MALKLKLRREKVELCGHCEKELSEVVIKLRANGYSNLGSMYGGFTWKFCSEECQDLWKSEMMEKRWDRRFRK